MGGVYAYYLFNKPVAGLAKARTDYEISAVDILEYFENDEEQANIKYLDKVLEVTGKVEKIEKKENIYNIYLLTDNMMSSVICELDEKVQTISIIEGDQVTIKGLCTGYLMDVVLIRSIIL